MGLSREAWSLWAKTPSKFGCETDSTLLGTRLWLALPQHLRDAADVGERLVRQWLPRQVQERLIGACGGELDDAARFVGFLAGVHDLGKADVAFQSQIAGSLEHSWLWEQVRRFPSCPANPGLPPEPRPKHAEVSDVILRRELRRCLPEVTMGPIVSISSIAGCHHGRLSGLGHTEEQGAPRLRDLSQWLDRHGPDWSRLWTQMIDDVLDRTGAQPVLQRILDNGGLSVSDQLMLCGLVTATDWIASNQELFPLTESGRHSQDASRAGEALDRLDLTRAWTPRPTGCPPYQRRFGWPANAKLRPCQGAALDAARSCSGPSLLVIEEEMGQGKTEAALLAAEVLAGVQGCGGVAFALPTMATSDSMFSRVGSWVSSLREESGGGSHSLFLGHSRAWLNPDYERLIRKTRAVGRRGSETVVAHEWFAGKRGMLAEFVVSTIDQVLMSALATRYVTMRHLGLAGKVVILDEVHSYDVYTSSYMARTLTWLAAHGVSVVLLSATLASGLRRQLEEAYAAGLVPAPKPEATVSVGVTAGSLGARKGRGRRRRGISLQHGDVATYPRVSVTDRGGTRFVAIDQRPTHRRVRLRLIDDDVAALPGLLVPLAVDGGVVGVVCNTVQRAQEAYEQLRARFGDDGVELHHSQFTAADRSAREQRLVAALGPKAHRGGGRPYRRIVVGTQVLEQSLDVDFDVLITDLAPGDSLAQRAGRLHRHDRPTGDRPEALADPVIHIRGVDLSGDVPVPDSGATAVYGDRVLLATLATLQPFFDGETWCLTHGLEDVVERIYGPDLVVPAAWCPTYDRAVELEATRTAESRRRASQFQLTLPADSRGYLDEALKQMIVEDAERNESLAAAHVRDIDPSLEVLLVQERGGLLGPLPWALPPDKTDGGWFVSETVPPPPRFARIVAASSVRLPRWLVAPWELDAAIAELEAQGLRAWQEDFRLKGQLVLRVDEDLRGELLGKSFGYDAEVGLHRASPAGFRGPDAPDDPENEYWDDVLDEDYPDDYEEDAS